MQECYFVTSRLTTKGLFNFAEQMAEKIANLVDQYSMQTYPLLQE